MALPQPGMISAVAADLAAFISTTLDGRPQVLIGPPAEAEPKVAESSQLLNLFFFRFEPSAFYADSTTADPRYMRLHCLITAFATPASETTPDGGTFTLSGGEVCLRLLEGVIQAFDQDPVRKISMTRLNTVSGQSQTIETLLQIILKPMATEELNQIWSTQGELHYRPSLLYEFAVAPVTPWVSRPDAKRVKEDGVLLDTEATLNRKAQGS